ncbi:Mmadhc [Symbiodinium pilosum]|uniref:Mmadhc protein n=1 Tax=Symbiodinium pilosum TaxID=2952 RepID=A0A812T471_SYMPI|nr:Mmadhc [Symbiodinium pilosum]
MRNPRDHNLLDLAMDLTVWSQFNMPPVSLSLADALGMPQPSQTAAGYQSSSPQKLSLKLDSALRSPMSMEPQKVQLPSVCLDQHSDILEDFAGLPDPMSPSYGPLSPQSTPATIPLATLDAASPHSLPAKVQADPEKSPVASQPAEDDDEDLTTPLLLLPKMLRFEALAEENDEDPAYMMPFSPKASDDEVPFGQSRDGQCVLFPPGLQPPPNTPSHGSVLHDQGTCRPCAWFHKPGGCKNGKECGHCHLCPEGEIKARKRAKQTVMRLGLATPKVSAGCEEEEEESSVMAFGIISPKAQVTRRSMKVALEPSQKKGSLSEEESLTTCVGSEQEMSDGSNTSPESAWASPTADFPQGLPSAQDLPSEGSALHGTGNCRPCAWFWKGSGCQNGKECKHCHMCDAGEIQRRRKMKQAMMRMSPKSQNQEAFARVVRRVRANQPQIDPLEYLSFPVCMDLLETKHRQSAMSNEMLAERQTCYGRLVARMQAFKAYFDAKQLWADFIDPSSGEPFHTSTSTSLFDCDERYRSLGFEILELGCCRSLCNKRFGQCLVMTSAFVQGTAEDVQPALGILEESPSPGVDLSAGGPDAEACEAATDVCPEAPEKPPESEVSSCPDAACQPEQPGEAVADERGCVIE